MVSDCEMVDDGWRERSGSSFTIQVREKGEEKIAKKRKKDMRKSTNLISFYKKKV